MAPRDAPHDGDDDDDQRRGQVQGTQLFEFDCPGCNANNPWPDGFRDREEVTCHYCGVAYRVAISDGGKLRLRES
jgi:uncharacterized Zn-finger protein